MSHDSTDPGIPTIDQAPRLVPVADEPKRAFISRDESERQLQLLCDTYEDEIGRLKHQISAAETEKLSAFGFLRPEALAKGLDRDILRTSFSWAEWLRDREVSQQKEIDTGKSTIDRLRGRVQELERDATRQKSAYLVDLDNARLQHETALKEVQVRHHAELQTAEARRQAEIRALSEGSAESIDNLHLEMMKLRSELQGLQERSRKEAYRMAAVIALRSKQLAAAQAEAASVHSRITAVYSSRSWRLGRLIRGLGRAVRFFVRRARAHA